MLGVLITEGNKSGRRVTSTKVTLLHKSVCLALFFRTQWLMYLLSEPIGVVPRFAKISFSLTHPLFY